MTTMRALAALALAMVLAALAVAGALADSRGGLDLLRPGSHASVGLGGDPFLSPLEDEVGWWSDPDLAAAGSMAELESGWPAGLGTGTGFESRQARWSGTAAGKLARMAWTAGAGVDAPRWEGAWEGGPGALSLRRSMTVVTTGLRMRMLPQLTWQVVGGAPTQGGGHTNWGAGIRYRHPSGSSLQSSWERIHRADHVQSSLYDQPIDLSTNLSQESERIDGRWVAGYGFSFEGTVGRTRWLPSEMATAAPLYHLDPSGTSGLDRAGLQWNTARHRALLRWTRVDLDLEGDLSWWGQPFGGFDYARARLDSWVGAFEAVPSPRARYLFEFEEARLDARARGEIESWPFTSTLVDLLGERRIFRLQGQARWERWHFAHEHAWSRRGRARIGAEWIEIHPQGGIESWRPAFLVFGKADDRVDRLNVERAQLGVLSLGLRRGIGGIDFDLGLEQCVFARALDSGGPAPADAGAAAAAPSVDHDRNGIGTRLRFTASKPF